MNKGNTTLSDKAGPIRNRIKKLDALRGFALLGVCMANYKELTLYAFYDVGHTVNVEADRNDTIANFLLYLLVDGKFYTIFSVLFGIGFSIIIGNAIQRGANGMRIFYRRMLLLLGFGFAHLMLLWSGDILMLYATMGMLLPFFWNCSDKTILRWAAFFLCLPIVSSTIVYIFNLNPCSWFYRQMDYWQNRFGIDDWGEWLHDRQSYTDLLKFLIMGAFERMTEFISSDRYFKVLGLFLVGLWIGKKRIYADITAHRRLLTNMMKIGFAIGTPFAILHAYDGITGFHLISPIHTIVETFSIYPLGLAYMATFALYSSRMEVLFSYPGKMALTCYISQSAIAVLLFYGVGLGWGMQMSLPQVILTSVGIFLFQTVCAHLWLRIFTYGPLEWIWRMLTYGAWLPLRKDRMKSELLTEYYTDERQP